MLHLIFFCLYVFNLSASDSDPMVTVIAYRKPHDRDITQVDNSGAAGGGAMGQHNCRYVVDRIEQKINFDGLVKLHLFENTVLLGAGFGTQYNNYCLMPKGCVNNTESNFCRIIVKIDNKYPSNMHRMFLSKEIEKSGLDLEIYNCGFILDNHLQRRKNSWDQALIIEPTNQQNRQGACLIQAQQEAERRRAELRAAEQEQQLENIRQLLQVREMQEQAEARAAIEMQEFDARRDHKIEENLARIELNHDYTEAIKVIEERDLLKRNLAKNKNNNDLVGLKSLTINKLQGIRSELFEFLSSIERDAMIEKINKLLASMPKGNDKKSLKNIQTIAAQANLIEGEFLEIKPILSVKQQHQDQQQSVVAESSEAGGGAASVATPVLVAAVAHSHVKANKPKGRTNNPYSRTNPMSLLLGSSNSRSVSDLCRCLENNHVVLGPDQRCVYCGLFDSSRPLNPGANSFDPSTPPCENRSDESAVNVEGFCLCPDCNQGDGFETDNGTHSVETSQSLSQHGYYPSNQYFDLPPSYESYYLSGGQRYDYQGRSGRYQQRIINRY